MRVWAERWQQPGRMAPTPSPLDKAVGWQTFLTSVARVEDIAGVGDDTGNLVDVVERHASARRFAPTFLQAFAFRSHRKGDPLLKALAAVRAMYASDRRTLAPDLPVSFLRRGWRPLVLPAGQPLDRRAYEVAVLVHLRDRLRAGDVWVEGSRAYRCFADYLLPRQTFEAMHDTQTLGLPFSTSWADYAADRAALLDTRLREVTDQAEAGRLVDVTLENGRLTISPLRRAGPEAVDTLAKRLYGMLPRVRHYRGAGRGRPLDRLHRPFHASAHRRGRRRPGRIARRRAGGRHQPRSRPDGRGIAGPDSRPIDLGHGMACARRNLCRSAGHHCRRPSSPSHGGTLGLGRQLVVGRPVLPSRRAMGRRVRT